MRANEPSMARRCLDMAAVLAAVVPPDRLRLEDIAERAGAPLATVRDLFGTAEGYLSAVGKDMFDERANALLEAVAELPPGLDRVRTLLTVFLDYAIRHATQYQWIVQAQVGHPHLAAEIRRRTDSVDSLLETDLHAMRWVHPLDCGHLVGALIREIALRETARGHPIAHMRAALWACLEGMATIR